MNTVEMEFNSHLPFWTLLKREVLRFIAIAGQSLVTPVVSSSLYLLVFGVSLGARVSVLEGFTYAAFVVPGLIIMGVMQNASANTSASLFMARYLGYIVDFLVMPISPAQFILAVTIAAMLRGILVGILVCGVSMFFTQLPWAHPIHCVCLTLIGSFLFAQFGIIVGIYSNSFDTLSMFNNFLVLPLIYLGGLFYPVSLLPPFWAKVSLGNPVLYLIAGFRRAVLGEGEVGFAAAYLVTGCFALLFFVWAALLIRSGKRMRV